MQRNFFSAPITLAIALGSGMLLTQYFLVTAQAVSTVQPAVVGDAKPLSEKTLGWATDRIDAKKTISSLTDRSVVKDSANQLHVAYGGDHLYYARYNGVQWNTEIADPAWGVGDFASIALDSNNNLHISYYDKGNRDLKYAVYSGNRWHIETVDSEGDVGGFDTSIALGQDGSPSIVYYDNTNRRIKYAQYKNNAWQIEVVGSGFTHVSLAIDKNNVPQLVYRQTIYQANIKLVYAHQAGNTWITETVASGSSMGQYASLFLDSNNRPHIAYLDGSAEDLMYARWTGSTWVTQTVDANAGWAAILPSLVLDSSDNPYIAYTNTNDRNLKYARWTGSLWNLETVESNDISIYKSLILDGLNNPNIIYIGNISGDLKYASWAGSSWGGALIDDGALVGAYSSLALAPTAPYTLSLSYIAEGNLKYGYYDGRTWQLQIVDDAGSLGTSVALSPEPPYTPHIAYYDAQNRLMKHAYWTGSVWITETIDSIGNTGNTGLGESSGISMAFAPSAPYTASIAYISNGNLKYAYWTGSSWVTTTLATKTNSTFVLTGPSLKLSATPPYTPHISYVETNFDDVMYSYWSGNIWVTVTVGSTQNGFSPTDLRLDSAGSPHILYRAGYEGLTYAHQSNNTWVQEIVDSEGADTSSFSLVLDNKDQAYVSYITQNSLMYARRNGNTWITETVDNQSPGFNNSVFLILDKDNHPRIAYYDGINGDLKFAWREQANQISQSGGVLGAFGTATFNFPANTFTDTVVVTYTVIQPSIAFPNIGVVFDLSAVYQSTGQPAQITAGQTYTIMAYYDEASVPQNVNEADLALYYWNSNGWIKEPTSTVDTLNNIITATPNHFSLWGGLFKGNSFLYLPLVQR